MVRIISSIDEVILEKCEKCCNYYMFRLYQFPVMYEIIILAHYLHHDLIFKLTDLQAVAAGSLINLATILYIHSIRVSYQITFDIYDIVDTRNANFINP